MDDSALYTPHNSAVTTAWNIPLQHSQTHTHTHKQLDISVQAGIREGNGTNRKVHFIYFICVLFIVYATKRTE